GYILALNIGKVVSHDFTFPHPEGKIRIKCFKEGAFTTPGSTDQKNKFAFLDTKSYILNNSGYPLKYTGLVDFDYRVVGEYHSYNSSFCSLPKGRSLINVSNSSSFPSNPNFSTFFMGLSALK